MKGMNVDIDFDRLWNYYNDLRAENGFVSIWSMYDVDRFDETPFPDATRLRYEVDEFWGHETTTLEVELKENSTWMDLWKSADQIIRLSGDSHHLFIEEFEPSDGGVLTLWTGS